MSQYPTLLVRHLTQYPHMQCLDVYKLLHQSLYGGSYAATDANNAEEWLMHQWGLANNTDEPLLEDIHPDGAWVRLHLSTYKAAGGDPSALLAALLRDANGRPRPSDGEAQMAALWDEFRAMVAADATLSEHFLSAEVTMFGRVHAELNYPAVQHSPIYIEAYNPLYRVLSQATAHALLAEQSLHR